MQILSLAVGAALALSCATVLAQDAAKPAADKHPVVVMKTNLGTIEMTLDAERAPISVKNFMSYVNEAFYDSTIFHRVIKGFMIHGGGFTTGMTQKPTKPPIKNEAFNGLKNKRGTVAMARTSIINSATCQFFINHVDNEFLDHTDETAKGFGYAVFGKVTMAWTWWTRSPRSPPVPRMSPASRS
jgi:cyclophilin family peptidyl-prolyl cis-trans isomerase